MLLLGAKRGGGVLERVGGGGPRVPVILPWV